MLLLWGMDLVIYWAAPLAWASFCPQLSHRPQIASAQIRGVRLAGLCSQER